MNPISRHSAATPLFRHLFFSHPELVSGSRLPSLPLFSIPPWKKEDKGRFSWSCFFFCHSSGGWNPFFAFVAIPPAKPEIYSTSIFLLPPTKGRKMPIRGPPILVNIRYLIGRSVPRDMGRFIHSVVPLLHAALFPVFSLSLSFKRRAQKIKYKSDCNSGTRIPPQSLQIR